MKSVVILYAGNKNDHKYDKVFDSKSAFERSLVWASSVENSLKTIILTEENDTKAEEQLKNFSNVKVRAEKSWTNGMIARACAEETDAAGADFAVVAWADSPFINNELTKQIINSHIEYKAEYTFADGFAGGFAPETVDRGAAAIIASIAADSQKSAGEKPASRDALFSIMSGDINSFEIETVIADKDYRMLRYQFECSTKSGLNACLKLYDKASVLKDGNDFDIYEVSDIAEKAASIQQSLPAYYNIQISASNNTKSIYSPYDKLFENKKLEDMSFEAFKKIVKKISNFSETAVVGLSLFGEPSLNSRFVDFVREVLSYSGLSLFIETDGLSLSEDMISAIAQVNDSTSAHGRIDWAVRIDSIDEKMYSYIHGIEGSNFNKVLTSVVMLEKYFENRVYPQFTRMNCNESQLEGFYRFWKEKESPSKGQLVIMKYDSFAGLLSDEKPADLSPVDRNPCWHIRRDMHILCDGTVVMCRSRTDETAGNILTDEPEQIWKNIAAEVENHINCNYCKKCKGCDEYYTFAF